MERGQRIEELSHARELGGPCQSSKNPSMKQKWGSTKFPNTISCYSCSSVTAACLHFCMLSESPLFELPIIPPTPLLVPHTLSSGVCWDAFLLLFFGVFVFFLLFLWKGCVVHQGSVLSNIFIDLHIGKMLVIFCTGQLHPSHGKLILKIKCETIDFSQLSVR